MYSNTSCRRRKGVAVRARGHRRALGDLPEPDCSASGNLGGSEADGRVARALPRSVPASGPRRPPRSRRAAVVTARPPPAPRVAIGASAKTISAPSIRHHPRRSGRVTLGRCRLSRSCRPRAGRLCARVHRPPVSAPSTAIRTSCPRSGESTASCSTGRATRSFATRTARFFLARRDGASRRAHRGGRQPRAQSIS